MNCIRMQKVAEVMEQKLIITGRLAGRNEEQAAARTHWSIGAALKKQNTQIVMYEAISQRLKSVDSLIRTAVIITFYEPNRKRDADNVMSGVKYILDGLINAKVIANDNQNTIELLINPIKIDSDRPRIEVIIRGELDRGN